MQKYDKKTHQILKRYNQMNHVMRKIEGGSSTIDHHKVKSPTGSRRRTIESRKPSAR